MTFPTAAEEASADPGIRQRILVFIKTRDRAFVDDVAAHFRIGHEGARKQLVRMERDGWLRRVREAEAEGVGRPRGAWSVTPAGDRLLPKAYDRLSLGLIAALQGGAASWRESLSTLARVQAESWAPRLAGLDARAKLQALRGIYAEEDPFVSLEIGEREARLVERNCPFLDAALEHPALCSLTLNTLENLLGHPVIREETFQAGHGRCVFRVQLDRELPRGEFSLESERAAAA